MACARTTRKPEPGLFGIKLTDNAHAANVTPPPGERCSVNRLTFNVVVPATTSGTGRSVFLAGELNKLNPPLSLWTPQGVAMNKVDPTHWTLALTGDAGTIIEYKYVLGDWAFVEKDRNCNETSNRSLTISAGGSVVNDRVDNWRNVASCGN